MPRTTFEVLLNFHDRGLRDLVQSDIIEDNNPALSIPSDSKTLQATDPTSLLLFVVLFQTEIIKDITKESVSWIFEYLKNLLGTNEKIAHKKGIITIKMKISDKHFVFQYNPETGGHNIEIED